MIRPLTLNLPARLVAVVIIDEFNRSFALTRTLPCDVQLGDHAAQYTLHAKYANLRSRGPNPFVDPGTCKVEAQTSEAMVRAIAGEQDARRP